MAAHPCDTAAAGPCTAAPSAPVAPAGPLQGVRVLDLTHVLSGPFACHQLAHLGAQVTKVEAPGYGDLARQLGADAGLNQRLMGASFLAQNAGKRSITLDLKSEAGRAVFRRLAARADVLVENFRPGVMERLGLGHAALRTLNPSLVYCAISGFGQDGPLRGLPAYDQIVQGMAGVMAITGAADSAPLRAGFPVADTVAGLTAAMAVCAALAEQPRRGRFIDVSMLDATLATLGWAVSNLLVAGQAPQPMGNDNVTASPSGAFRTADGLINIAANQQAQFEALVQVLGRPELAADARFARRAARLQHRGALKTALEQVLQTRPTAHWWPLLTQAGVPAGPVWGVEQALAQPQLAARGQVARFDAVPGVGRPVPVLRPGLHLDGQPLSVARPPPALGQHSREILAELGYAEAEIQDLLHAGVC